MSVYYGTEALILASSLQKEADRFVVFFTKDLGRIDAIAKGVRLAKSKLRGHLCLFSHVRIMLTAGKDYWQLLDAETLSFPRMTYILPQQEFARFFLRIVSAGVPDLGLWDIVSDMPKLDSRQALFLLKVRTLAELGMISFEEEGLKEFFSPEAARGLQGNDRKKFHMQPEDELGIDRILRLHHVL